LHPYKHPPPLEKKARKGGRGFSGRGPKKTHEIKKSPYPVFKKNSKTPPKREGAEKQNTGGGAFFISSYSLFF